MPDRQSSSQTDRPGDAHSTEGARAAGRETPALEWITAAFGLVLVLGAFGLIIYGVISEDTPPRLKAETNRIIPVDGRYLVELTVYNNGGMTAAAVHLEGVLEQDGKPIESASTTLDYVPAHSEIHAGLFFRHDPRAYRLRLEADAYVEP